MWNYEKRLQFPVNIKEPNAKLAQVIMSQYGGPDGEMGASMRYLSQRYATPYREVAGLLTDIGTEASEMFHSGCICCNFLRIQQSHFSKQPHCFCRYFRRLIFKQRSYIGYILFPNGFIFCKLTEFAI